MKFTAPEVDKMKIYDIKYRTGKQREFISL